MPTVRKETFIIEVEYIVLYIKDLITYMQKLFIKYFPSLEDQSRADIKIILTDCIFMLIHNNYFPYLTNIYRITMKYPIGQDEELFNRSALKHSTLLEEQSQQDIVNQMLELFTLISNSSFLFEKLELYGNAFVISLFIFTISLIFISNSMHISL